MTKKSIFQKLIPAIGAPYLFVDHKFIEVLKNLNLILFQSIAPQVRAPPPPETRSDSPPRHSRILRNAIFEAVKNQLRDRDLPETHATFNRLIGRDTRRTKP
jgi:hypothetical protein